MIKFLVFLNLTINTLKYIILINSKSLIEIIIKNFTNNNLFKIKYKMFYETSHEKLFYTESWPTSTSALKGNFSKSINSLYRKKTKSSPYLNKARSFSSSRSSSLSSIVDEE